MTSKELYDHDFYEWTKCNAALLRAGRLDQVDLEHVAEEIEDMGKSERRDLSNRLRVLLTHLLKWSVQSGRRSSSWESTIHVQRAETLKLLKQMPSLRVALAEELPEIYELAKRKATGETGLAGSYFPEECPFSLQQILDDDFLPG